MVFIVVSTSNSFSFTEDVRFLMFYTPRAFNIITTNSIPVVKIENTICLQFQ